MGNALLALSGPAFGNMDITTYNVYSALCLYSTNTYVVFSGHDWDWCIIDGYFSTYVFTRPVALTSSSLNSAMYYPMNDGISTTYQCQINWSGSTSSLSAKFANNNSTVIAYVPSN